MEDISQVLAARASEAECERSSGGGGGNVIDQDAALSSQRAAERFLSFLLLRPVAASAAPAERWSDRGAECADAPNPGGRGGGGGCRRYYLKELVCPRLHLVCITALIMTALSVCFCLFCFPQFVSGKGICFIRGSDGSSKQLTLH